MFMKTVKKILLAGGIGLLVLIVVAVIVVGLFLGKIVKAGVERVGPKITQTTLTVDAVDLSLLTGSATVKNLVVGNPARQIGWVCACGANLDASLTCPACHKRYAKQADGLRPL